MRYDDIYRMDEIKSLSFHIMFYRLYRGVANTLFPVIPFHHLSAIFIGRPPRGVKGRQKQMEMRTSSQDTTSSSFLNDGLYL